MEYKIVEKSFFANIARRVLRTNGVAMVLGDKIHLSGVTSPEFLKNEKWVKHELVHIEQFRKNGFYRFLYLYLIESIKKGYYMNKYEVEARKLSGEE